MDDAVDLLGVLPAIQRHEGYPRRVTLMPTFVFRTRHREAVAGAPLHGTPKDHRGVPGATIGKCAVSPLVQNITFLPGAWRVRNARKINACLKVNVRGFLATL